MAIALLMILHIVVHVPYYASDGEVILNHSAGGECFIYVIILGGQGIRFSAAL